MHASPYTAMVGDGRRLATELVVIRASATQEMYPVVRAALDLAPAAAADPDAARSAGMSMVLTMFLQSLRRIAGEVPESGQAAPRSAASSMDGPRGSITRHG